MDGDFPSPGWPPPIAWMVIHHPKYDYQPFKRWSTIFQITVPNDPQDGQTPSPRKVTRHWKVCHPPTQGRRPTIIRMVTYSPMIWLNTIHHPKGGHPTTVEWSSIISRMVNKIWSLTLAQPSLLISLVWCPLCLIVARAYLCSVQRLCSAVQFSLMKEIRTNLLTFYY